MIKKAVVILILFGTCLVTFAQESTIKITANNQLLTSVLAQLRNQYGFNFSFSESQLSKYTVTVNQEFDSKEAALKELVKDLPFRVKISHDVFIIIPDQRKPIDLQQNRINISGQILEEGTYEPLPYSNVLINQQHLVSDLMGGINYSSAANDSVFHLQISHLGYFVYDTTFYASIDQKFLLTPATQKISEITVLNKKIERSTQVGEQAGKMKLNPQIASFLPGQGDNSVFNLLRLMPGIQAAGEQTADLFIWGSYEGQTQVTFDEFLLFGFKNYNDHITVINPLIVKNIDIYKSGYDARFGNRVGGVIDILGKNGNQNKPSFSFNLNPTTLNGLVELPILKKSSLLLSYRQTYYNIYQSSDFNFQRANLFKVRDRDYDLDIKVEPEDYQFSDYNLKYTVNFDNGDLFYLSYYGGGDNFTLETETEVNLAIRRDKKEDEEERTYGIELLNNEETKQHCYTTFYGKNWENGHVSKLIFSQSNYQKSILESIHSKVVDYDKEIKKDSTGYSNLATENSIRFENIVKFKKGQKIEFGAGFYNHVAQFQNYFIENDSAKVNVEQNYKNNRLYGFVHNTTNLGTRISFNTGVRFNHNLSSQTNQFGPRLNVRFKLTDTWKANVAWGIYHQYMFKLATVDRDQNYSYLWVTSNRVLKPLKATHRVFALNYFKNDLTINIEGFSKNTSNLSRRVYGLDLNANHAMEGYSLFVGNSKAIGFDALLKKDWKNLSFWASYTLSKTSEQFADNRILLRQTQFILAPHDQRHELKFATILQLKNWNISGDYVYGSGLNILKNTFENSDVSYNRMDLATTYRFTKKQMNYEIGLSILNLFNTQNLKYSNLKIIELNKEVGSIKVYSNAVPFSPSLFLKISF